MGSVQKVGDDYFIEFYARGLKYQQKIGPDREAAKKALQTIESKIEQGEAATIVRDVDHDIFFQDFLKYAQEIHSPRTEKRFAALIEDFQTFLKQAGPTVKKLSEITPRVIELYKSYLIQLRDKASPAVNPKIVNFTLFLLRDVLEYAIKLGYLNDNPSLHIRLLKVVQNRPLTVLNEEEIKQIFNTADSYLWFFIEFILLTGVDAREIVNLQWSAVDLSQQVFKVSPGMGREVKMNARGTDILKQLQNKKYKSTEFVFTDQSGRELTMQRLEETLQRIVEQCGIKKTVGFHSFRHTFARNIIKKGVTVSLLYKILGFEDIARINIYSRFLSDYWEHEIFKV